MDEKFKSFLLKAPSKKTSSPASSFDKYLETFKSPIEPTCETSFRDADDDEFSQFSKTNEDKEARRCLFPFNFSGFQDIEFDLEDVHWDDVIFGDLTF